MDAKTHGRRLAAARELAGYKSVGQLAAALDSSGLGTKTLGKVERGERRLEPYESAWIAEKLELPRWWFEQEDLHALGPAEASDVAQRLDTIEQILMGLGEAVTELATDRREADAPPQADRGSSS